MSLIATNRFNQILTLPIALPQTELRRGRSLRIATLPLAFGQSLELRSLTLHLLKLLTPGVSPVLNTTTLGLVSVGVYLTPMMTGGAALVTLTGPGAASANPSAPSRFTSPGTYYVVVSNNTANIDLAVIVTGSVKFTE